MLEAARAAPAEMPWYWGPLAAAAIVVLWTAVHASRIEPERDPLRDMQVARIAEMLGGGEDAARHAELIVPPRLPEPLTSFGAEQPW